MPNAAQLKTAIEQGHFDQNLSQLYPNKEQAKKRLIHALSSFEMEYGRDRQIFLFSAPGRSEITGNHTDHQHGLCLAAGVDLDVIAVVALSDQPVIRVHSQGFNPDEINLSDLDLNPEEYGTSKALIKGIAAKMKEDGHVISGFDAFTTSNVLKGSGLSSSAAFEVLIATIINQLFCQNAYSPIAIAQIGQYAENTYFGKPCGLLDQMASSVGGFVFMDFEDPKHPIVERLDFDFSKVGYDLCIVDTGGSHSDLTDDYASVTEELSALCAFFDEKHLRKVQEEDFYKAIPKLREEVSDRAIIRAIHVFAENKRVGSQKEALKNKDLPKFLDTILESGRSSFMYLQNVYSIHAPEEQGLSLALALCEKLLMGKGAFRVHGGGFAGTIQAFVPKELTEPFRLAMEAVFGIGKCYVLTIRPVGGTQIKEDC